MYLLNELTLLVSSSIMCLLSIVLDNWLTKQSTQSSTPHVFLPAEYFEFFLPFQWRYFYMPHKTPFTMVSPLTHVFQKAWNTSIVTQQYLQNTVSV